MSFSHVQPLPGIAGTVLVGTVSGNVLYSAPYLSEGGAPVAPKVLQAFQLVWDALPEVLGANGEGRFDLMVQQQTEGQREQVTTYWQSGLSAGALCGQVARRLRLLRSAVYAPHQRTQSHPGLDITEVSDSGVIEWVSPEERVLHTLAQVKSDPWDGLREVQ